jgi:hypothetical protein
MNVTTFPGERISPCRRSRPVAALLVTLCLSSLLAAGCGPADPSKSGPLPIGYLDLPVPNMPIKGDFQFLGWSLHPSGIRDVSIYVDGNFLMKAKIGLNRIDIGKAFLNNPDAVNAGWGAVVATTAIPPGPHEFVIQARSKSGAVRDIANRQIVVER